MRRAAEWFLLPLFLLPVAAAIGFHFWAQHDYELELARYTQSGGTQAHQWLTGNGPGRTRVAAQARGLLFTPRLQFDGRGVWIKVNGRRAWLPSSAGHPAVQLPRHWTLSPSYPRGLAPNALANPQTRLALETAEGAPPLESLDAPSRAFCELLDSQKFGRLATVDLPAATKLYLVQRWRRQGVSVPQLGPLERLLTFMPRAEAVLLGMTGPFAPGIHVVGDALVYARPPEDPLITPRQPRRPRTLKETSWASTDGELVALHYLAVGELMPYANLLWQGRLETPLAGQWAFVRRFGPHWWQAPPYRRSVGPLSVLLLAFLCIPSALLIAMRRRRRLDEARSRFINELAHDLRTPLTSLRLYAEMLGRDPCGDAKRDRYAEVLTRESERVTAMLGNLLDLSRLDDGRRHLELQAIDVAPLAAQAREAFTVLYPERGADLSLAGSEDTQATADPSALARCLANLLENAGKYTEPGTSIRVSWRTVGDEVRVIVKDAGPGIPASERSTAFERYARGARAKRDGLPGTGLGLALVKELLTEMRGSVRLLSPPEGTEIEMRLPKAPA